MGIVCKIFGHKFDKCICSRCGYVKDHNWQAIAGKCREKCTICGKEREEGEEIVKKYASVHMNNPSWVDKCVSALLECANRGNNNDLSILQNIVAKLGKEELTKTRLAVLWLSTNVVTHGGNYKLMKLLADIAIERLSAPLACPHENNRICSLYNGDQSCPFPTAEYYPLCSFMQGNFFTEWMPGTWEWNLEYGKSNKV